MNDSHQKYIISFYNELFCNSKTKKNDTVPVGLETRIPDVYLRSIINGDHSLSAIVSVTNYNFSFTNTIRPLIFDKNSCSILIPNQLRAQKKSVTIFARFAIECLSARKDTIDQHNIFGLIEYCFNLISLYRKEDISLFLDLMPSGTSFNYDQWKITNIIKCSNELVIWLINFLAIESLLIDDTVSYNSNFFNKTTEQIIVYGGGSRLLLDSATNLNKYGIPPHPRPDAIHFSSSTATPVSDYGFALIDLVRSTLRKNFYRVPNNTETNVDSFFNVVPTKILNMFNLDSIQADIFVTPSGTDSELLSMFFAVVAAGKKKITSIIVSPNESGRGVFEAASGKYFEDVQVDEVISKAGEILWNQTSINPVVISTRDEHGVLLNPDQIDQVFKNECIKAISSGSHVVARILYPSKTHVSAPSLSCVRDIYSNHSGSIDVLVDACQLRCKFDKITEFINIGWMVEVTGSKFLTGPPYSGALITPINMRSRINDVLEHLMFRPPFFSHIFYRQSLTNFVNHKNSYGSIFRWLPALLEAKIYNDIPEELKIDWNDKFKEAVKIRLECSPYLSLIDTDINELHSNGGPFIFTFQVQVLTDNNIEMRPLNEGECNYMYKILNSDATNVIRSKDPNEILILAKPVNIGQTVCLGSYPNTISVLRFVLGVRFFNNNYIYNSESSFSTELNEAYQALSKIEIIAKLWSTIDQHAL